MNSMEILRRINEKYDKGFLDGITRIYRPGLTFGVFRKMYHRGHKQGSRMKRLTDFETK
jgi:hypothetical protein